MTATGDWLADEAYADVALVLIIDGISIGYTTHPDADELSARWSEATGDEELNIYGGCRVQGTISRSIEMFAAKIQPSNLSFQILDFNEILTPLMFGEGRTDIRKTYLRETVGCGDTNLPADDVTQLTGAPRIYCGLETMTVVDEDSDFWVVERGVAAIFPRTVGGGRSHEIPLDGGAKPAITDTPAIWLNREVALYLCHRVDGVWSAGAAGSSDNDAELIWAGRIKSWSERGDGTIDIDCVEITEMLKTTIGARVYTGSLLEGMTLSAADSEMQVDVTHKTRGPNLDVTTGQPIVTEERFTTYIVTLDTTGRKSHQQLAENITSELQICFAGATETYGPEGMTAQLFLYEADGHYQMLSQYGLADVNDTFVIRISLAPFVWRMLGFQSDRGGARNGTLGGKVATVELEARSGTTNTWERRASELPKKFAVHFDETAEPIQVEPSTDDVFVRQSAWPPGFANGTTDGFLLFVASNRIAGVRQTDDNTFNIVGELLNFTFPSDESRVGADFEEFLDAPDNGDGSVEVRQVWIEPQANIGTGMLRAILSTGSTLYNGLLDTLPSGLGAAFAETIVDLQSWLDLNLPYLLVVLKPTPLVTYIESALRLVNAHAVWHDGKLAVVRPTESGQASSGDDPDLVYLDETNKAQQVKAGENMTAVTQRTMVERNPESIINRFSLRYQARIDASFGKTITVNAMASQSDYGQVKAVVVDALGIYDVGGVRSAAVTAWAANAATALAYFSRPVALASRTYGVRLLSKLFPGAKTSASDLAMVNPATGRRGVAGLLGWAVRTRFNFDSGVGDLSYAFQPDAVTTSDVTRLAIWAPSARVDETDYDGDVIATHVVNVVGIALAVSAPPFLELSGLNVTDTVRIRKPNTGDEGMIYSAWSPWSSDAHASPPVPVFGSTWFNAFDVLDQDGVKVLDHVADLPTLTTSAAAALLDLQALSPIDLTGATDYDFEAIDSSTGDNRGGLSLIVEVLRGASGGVAGYDDAIRTLYFRAHEYSLEEEAVDVSWFQPGDPVHIVHLSPPDPDASVEWFRTVESVDAATNSVVLTVGLSSPAWPGTGFFVMEWDSITEAVANKPTQLQRGAFIADELLRSTGNAANDAYLWGGDVSGGGADVALEQDQPYRRLNNAADDMGLPASVHKLHETRDWLNTFLAWHSRPTYLNVPFLTPATHVPDGTVQATVMPPTWAALIPGTTRALRIEVLAAMETGSDGAGVVRVMTSISTPSDDQDFEEPVYVDGTQYVDLAVPQTTTPAWYIGTITIPALRSGPVAGCYITVDVRPADPANGQVNVFHVKVMEDEPA